MKSDDWDCNSGRPARDSPAIVAFPSRRRYSAGRAGKCTLPDHAALAGAGPLSNDSGAGVPLRARGRPSLGACDEGRGEGDTGCGGRACGRARFRGGSADEEGRAGAHSHAGPTLDLAIRDHRLRLGVQRCRKHGLRLPADAALLRAFRQTARAPPGRLHGQLRRPQRYIHRRNRFRRVAARRVRHHTKPEQCALRRADGPHPRRGVRHRLRGVRVPLGVPNLDLYGTVGARNFFSGTKITVTGPHGLFSGV